MNTSRSYNYPAPGGGAGSKPHAVTSVAASGGSTATLQYAYDGSGNTTCRPAAAAANTCAADGTAGAESQSLTWNDEGTLSRSSDKTGETTYTYDAYGSRLIRRDPGGATLYLPNGLEIRKPKTGAAVGTRYYAHAGATIAVRTPTALSWLINDHQGTATATVSGDVLTVARRRTMPFGADRGTAPAAWAGDKGLVGGTRDNTGLTHLGAREYDPAIGRFTSVDPLMDLADPQQWGAYNYADDSPVSQSDPTGLDPCSTGGQGCDDPDGDGVYTPQPAAGGGSHGGGNNGGGSYGGGGNNGGTAKPSGNVAQSVPVVQQKERCGWFAPVCHGFQRSMEWVHENQDTLARIAIDLAEIDSGASLFLGGGTLAAGGGVLEIASVGIATEIAVPAAAVGVTGIVVGGPLVAHGSHNLGQDIRDLHWNNQASRSGDSANPDAAQPAQPKINRQKQDGHIKGTPQYQNRVKGQKPTSTWLDGEDADALTLEAWNKGTPVAGNPNRTQLLVCAQHVTAREALYPPGPVAGVSCSE